jgi:hypothetical protein
VSCIRIELTTVSVASDEERRRLRESWDRAFAREAASFRAELNAYLDLVRRAGEQPVALSAWPDPPGAFDRASIENWTHACRRVRQPLSAALTDVQYRVEQQTAERRADMTTRSVEAELVRLERLLALADGAEDDVASGALQTSRLDQVVDGVRRNRARLLVDADADARARAEELARAALDAAEREDHDAARDRLDELRFLVQRTNDRVLRRPAELQRAQVLSAQLAGLAIEEPAWLAHLDAVIDDGAAADPDLMRLIGRRVEAERLAEALERIGYAVPDGFGGALAVPSADGNAAATLVVRADAPGIDDGVRFRSTADGTIAAEVVRDASVTLDPEGDRRIEEAWLTADLPRLLEALTSLGVDAGIERRDPAGSHPLERVSAVRPLGAASRGAQRTRRAPAMESPR